MQKLLQKIKIQKFQNRGGRKWGSINQKVRIKWLCQILWPHVNNWWKKIQKNISPFLKKMFFWEGTSWGGKICNNFFKAIPYKKHFCGAPWGLYQGFSFLNAYMGKGALSPPKKYTLVLNSLTFRYRTHAALGWIYLWNILFVKIKDLVSYLDQLNKNKNKIFLE